MERTTLQLGDAQLIVPSAELARLYIEKIMNKPATVVSALVGVPRIGTEWVGQGGVHAGVARGNDGQPDYHLIVGDESAKKMPQKAALEWALRTGAPSFADFSLFNRREQALCFANVPELFKKEWYWSCEQYAPHPVYAWVQGFGYGSQDYTSKVNDCWARAVRRLVIQ